MNDVRLYISLACCRDIKSQFLVSVTGMIKHLLVDGLPEGYLLRSYFMRVAGQASCLSEARQNFLNEAISMGATHWLSLDDDMIFPADSINRMLLAEKDIVTANYRRKTLAAEIGVAQGVDGLDVNTPSKIGLEEIGWMGGGLFLARVKPLADIKRPHFAVLWNEEKQNYLDQDNFFSMTCRQNGLSIWCDHDLSKEVRHVGDHEYQFSSLIGGSK